MNFRFARTAMVVATACLLATRVLAADAVGPLQVSPDGRFLMQPDGSPFFWLADTGWALFQRLDRVDAEKYLADRANKGFNVIQAVAFGGPPVDLPATPNAYGELPLINNDPARPNPRYFDHIDWVVDRAERHGLRVAMLPVWGAGVIGGWVGAPTGVLTPAKAEAYGRWLGVRYRGRGIVWILGGDTNPIGVTRFSLDKPDKQDATIVDYRAIYDALAKGLIAGEGGNPLITYHLTCCSWPGTAQPRTSLYLGDRAWLSMNMLQSSHFRDPEVIRKLVGVDFAWDATRNYESVRLEYDASPTRPIIDGEPRYEDLAVDVESDPKIIAAKGYWKAYDVRNAAYHAVFAGAAGHSYGNHSVWQFYDPKRGDPAQAAMSDLPWHKAIHSPGAAQMRHLKALMLSRPYFTRIPDQSLISGETGVGESHVNGTRDRGGSYAMIFLPKGQPVTVDLTRITGLRATAWWFDPRTGAAARVERDFPTTGPRVFIPPTSGPDTDWILVLDDAGRQFRPPGVLPVALDSRVPRSPAR